MKTIGPVLLVALFALVGCVTTRVEVLPPDPTNLETYDPPLPAVHVGEVFPDLPLSPLTPGSPSRLSEVKAKVIVLDFWATGCPSSTLRHPVLVDRYREYHPLGLEIVSLSFDEDRQAALDYLARAQLPWPQVFQGPEQTSPTAVALGQQWLPDTVILDGDGKVLFIQGDNSSMVDYRRMGERIRNRLNQGTWVPPQGWSWNDNGDLIEMVVRERLGLDPIDALFQRAGAK